MPEIKIAGVLRAGAFSPNHVGNDAAIFNGVAEQLRKRGCQVKVYGEEQFKTMDVTENVVLNMCREHSSMEKLQRLEDEGKLVINSGYGIENCTRERMTRILLGSGISYPESLVVSTDENVKSALEAAGISSCWIKRGEGHSMHKEDVSYCRHSEEAQEILHEFFYRGIHKAVFNRHLEGDLIKFYGIVDGSFFYYFYPFSKGHEKYGLDIINGRPHEFKFDAEDLKNLAIKAAEALGVEIFGGDCIIAADGTMSIIDLNDWPSFAPCRTEAAAPIARYVLGRINNNPLRR